MLSQPWDTNELIVLFKLSETPPPYVPIAMFSNRRSGRLVEPSRPMSQDQYDICTAYYLIKSKHEGNNDGRFFTYLCEMICELSRTLSQPLYTKNLMGHLASCHRPRPTTQTAHKTISSMIVFQPDRRD